MQATTAPSAPQATVAPAAPGTSLTAAPSAEVLLPGVPRTVADVIGLRERREELSNQLISATGRRASLSRQLAGKEGIDRAGIESHMAVLDKRIMQLESDIAETGRQLTMTPGALVASTEASRQVMGMDPNRAATVSVFFTILVLAPLAIGAARLMWKRAGRPAPPPAISGDAARRLERLEQGMDAIAIEIERVSEGQRFVTRLLSEAHTNAPLAIPRQAEEASASASPPIR